MLGRGVIIVRLLHVPFQLSSLTSRAGERDFDDLKILISHQKAKHFKCERCGRRLNTAGGKFTSFRRIARPTLTRTGLSVHMNQVHKETLTTVDNALPNRAGLEVEIFGMEGIPDEVTAAHNQRILTGFYQAEAERRVATGNPGPGGNQGNQAKKPKFESPSDLKKRLAEHKARKEAEKAGGTGSGGNTPMPMEGVQNSPLGQSPSSFVSSPLDSPKFNSLIFSRIMLRHILLLKPLMALHKVRVMDQSHKTRIRSLR